MDAALGQVQYRQSSCFQPEALRTSQYTTFCRLSYFDTNGIGGQLRRHIATVSTEPPLLEYTKYGK